MPFSARKWAAGAGTPGQGCSTVCSRGGGRPAPRRGVLPFPSGIRSESMGSNPTRRLLMTTDLLTCLAAIPDRRRAEGKMYGQAGVILFAILAMVSGARSYRQIHWASPLGVALPHFWCRSRAVKAGMSLRTNGLLAWPLATGMTHD